MPGDEENEIPESPIDGAAKPASEPGPYAVFRNPNYIRYLSGFACSAFGLQMMAAAVLYEVFHRTGSEFMLGLTGLVRALPVVLFALLAGHAVDTLNRKWIVVSTQAGFVLVAAGLAVASFTQAPIAVLYVLLFLAGCVRSFNGPGRNALIPLLVGKGEYEGAVKWMTGMFQFAALVAPLVAGRVIDLSGKVWIVYASVAALCGVFALTASWLKPREQVRQPSKLSVQSLLAGFGFLRREQTVLGALLLDLFAVLIGGATTLIPSFVDKVLLIEKSQSATAQGVLRASLYGGAFLMAMILAHRPPFRKAGWWLLGSVAVFGFCIVLFGLSTSLWLSAAALVLAGAADQISVVIRHVLVQVRTPDELRGRVGAVNSLFIECSNELGAFESGLVAACLGTVGSIVTGGIGTVVIVGLIAWRLPDLRNLGTLNEKDDKKG